VLVVRAFRSRSLGIEVILSRGARENLPISGNPQALGVGFVGFHPVRSPPAIA